ncbi:MAG: fibronectin type III domain-containing protein [Leptospira sp.]|nr:fibronectin type III domain-containing protein [Leptospira sp.]
MKLPLKLTILSSLYLSMEFPFLLTTNQHEPLKSGSKSKSTEPIIYTIARMYLYLLLLLLLSAPIITAPGKKAVFEWKPVAGSSSYSLEVKDGKNKTLIDTKLQDTKFELNLRPGNYQFRVSAINKFGKLLIRSPWHELILSLQDSLTRNTPENLLVLEEVKIGVLKNDIQRVSIRGKNFTPKVSLTVRSASGSIPVRNVVFQNSSNLLFSLDLKNAAPGNYDLILEGPDKKQLVNPNFYLVGFDLDKTRKLPSIIAAEPVITEIFMGVKQKELQEIVLTGNNFTDGIKISVRSGHSEIPVKDFIFSDSTRIRFTLNLSNVKPDTYDLSLENPGKKILVTRNFYYLGSDITKIEKIEDIDLLPQINQVKFGLKEGKKHPVLLEGRNFVSVTKILLKSDFAVIPVTGFKTEKNAFIRFNLDLSLLKPGNYDLILETQDKANVTTNNFYILGFDPELAKDYPNVNIENGISVSEINFGVRDIDRQPVKIIGKNFSKKMKITVKSGGRRIPVIALNVPDANHLEFILDLSGAKPDVYDLILENPDRKSFTSANFYMLGEDVDALDTLAASAIEAEIEDVIFGGRNGKTQPVEISGKKFSNKMKIALRSSFGSIPLRNMAVVNSEKIRFSMDLSGAEPDMYDLYIECPGYKTLRKENFYMVGLDLDNVQKLPEDTGPAPEFAQANFGLKEKGRQRVTIQGNHFANKMKLYVNSAFSRIPVSDISIRDGSVASFTLNLSGAKIDAYDLIMENPGKKKAISKNFYFIGSEVDSN